MRLILNILFCLLPLALIAGEGAEVESLESSEVYRFDSAAQVMVISQALRSYYNIDTPILLSSVQVLETLNDLPERVEILDAPSNLSSNMLLKVRFMKGDKAVGDVIGSFRAKQFGEALVAKRSVRSNSEISQDDFVVEQVDLLDQRESLVPLDADLSQYQTTLSIPSGRALTWNVLKSRPLVHKGDYVEVVASSGALKITSKAMALSDAGLNEIVTLRNLSSHRQFQAKVINENLAQISF